MEKYSFDKSIELISQEKFDSETLEKLRDMIMLKYKMDNIDNYIVDIKQILNPYPKFETDTFLIQMRFRDKITNKR